MFIPHSDDAGPTIKQHRVNVESHVVLQLGMIRQAYNPRSNIFYAKYFCSFEQIVSYL